MTSYRRIKAVAMTVEILRTLAKQERPMTGSDIAATIDAPLGTVMCHLASLRDERLVDAVADHWKLGMGMALFWARAKADLTSERERIDRQLEMLGVYP